MQGAHTSSSRVLAAFVGGVGAAAPLGLVRPLSHEGRAVVRPVVRRRGPLLRHQIDGRARQDDSESSGEHHLDVQIAHNDLLLSHG